MRSLFLTFSLLGCVFFLHAQQARTIRITFEPEFALQEKHILYPLDDVRLNERATNGYHSAMLSTALVSQIQTVPLPVNQGEIMDVQTFARYEKRKDSGLLRSIATTLAAAAVISKTNQSKRNNEGVKTNLFPSSLPWITAGAITLRSVAKELRGRAKAILVVDVLDAQRNFIERREIPIDKKLARNQWQQLQTGINIEQDGFVIVTLLSESKNPVWFDDLQITTVNTSEVSTEEGQPTDSAPAKSYDGNATIMMTSSYGDGCGDDDDCLEEFEGLGECFMDPYSCPYGAYLAAECGDMQCWKCSEGQSPCTLDPYSCECDPAYCSTGGDPCDTDPYGCECTGLGCDDGDNGDTNCNDCSCADYANANPCTCNLPDCGDNGGGDDGQSVDCAGVPNGSAWLNNCGECVEGTTGKTNSWFYQDNDNDGWGNEAVKIFCSAPGPAWVSRSFDQNDNCFSPDNTVNCLASPCQNESLNEMTTFANTQTALRNLRHSVLGNSTREGDNYEIGYPVYDNNGIPYFHNAQVGSPDNPEVSLEYIWEFIPKIQGFWHSHYEGTEYTFSADDLYNFFKFSVERGNPLSGDFIGVVNPNGSAYALVVEDASSLIDYLMEDNDNDPATPETFISLQDFSNDYEFAKSLGQALYPSDPEKAAEYKLVNFLNAEGAGIKLYKATYDVNNGYQNFNRIDAASNGNIQPCN